MSSVYRFRHPNAITIVAAVATIVAWFVASNHCALGLMGAPKAATASHEHCHGHSAPAKGKHNGEETSCCKSLQVPAVTQAKNLVCYDTSVFTLKLFFVTALTLSNDADSRLIPVEFDTGPPPTLSF